MLTFILIPILICGIIWIQNDPQQSFRVSTFQGWLIYIHAAKCGFTLVVSSFIFMEVILGSAATFLIGKIADTEYQFTPINIISDLIKVSLPSELTSNSGVSENLYGLYAAIELISISILSICTTYILTWILKSGIWHKNIFRTFYLHSFWEKHSIFDFFILETMQKKDWMQVTLENRKCYVGLVSRIQEPNEETTGHKHITLIPIISGYRHKDTLSIIFTNQYPKDPKHNKINYNDAIIIPIESITSVSGFDIDIYNQTADNLTEDTGIEFEYIKPPKK
ncbi:hypothetical protein ACFO0O_17680 [Cobetia amphilecti]|uniref:Uncharacterized protein n=1 Tax=Cobetia amphilecti TaxID=1055104 RepID=A0ABT6UTL7_9GAMM|nr:hypothetical protein [Cobetia amphilecti]MDI5886053.1 hypothetical protein [Cobetia amphilecti]